MMFASLSVCLSIEGSAARARWAAIVTPKREVKVVGGSIRGDVHVAEWIEVSMCSTTNEEINLVVRSCRAVLQGYM